MRARRHLAWALAFLSATAACAGARRGPPPSAGEEPSAAPAPPQPEGEVGIASFYGRRHHGRRTASGERFDMRAMTCAHRTLPFGTRLRVVDLDTGRSVVVRVNDRGPFAEARVVDLSLGAARKLGIVDRGLARVRLEPVDGEEEDAALTPERAGARARRP